MHERVNCLYDTPYFLIHFIWVNFETFYNDFITDFDLLLLINIIDFTWWVIQSTHIVKGYTHYTIELTKLAIKT